MAVGDALSDDDHGPSLIIEFKASDVATRQNQDAKTTQQKPCFRKKLNKFTLTQPYNPRTFRDALNKRDKILLHLLKIHTHTSLHNVLLVEVPDSF